MKRHGRKSPYSEAGIKRLPCFRCGRPAHAQWQVCADGNLYRPICLGCDLELNKMVLHWMGFPDWKEKHRQYAKSKEPRTKG